MRIQALYGLKKKEIGSKSVSHNSGYSYLDTGFGGNETLKKGRESLCLVPSLN